MNASRAPHLAALARSSEAPLALDGRSRSTPLVAAALAVLAGCSAAPQPQGETGARRLAAPAALAMDAVVSSDRGSPSMTVSTPSFSSVAGDELLLAFVSSDDVGTPNTVVTAVSGAGLTWVLVRRTNLQQGTAEIWRAFSAAPLSSVKVTATLSQSVSSSLTVMSFAGVDTSGSSGSGAIGAVASGSGVGAPTAMLATTRAGSWVVGVGNDWDRAAARTLGPGQTLVHQYLSPVGDTYWVQRQTAPIPAAGTLVTINDTAPATDQYNLSIVEVLPAGVAPTYTVSGTIAPAASGSGASVSLTQGTTAIAQSTADSGGSYTLANVPDGSYTVTPSRAGYSFSPPSQSISVSGANVSGVDFTATPLTPSLVALPAGVLLGGTAGGASPAPVGVAVSSTGGGALAFTATSDSAWLAAAPASATTPQVIQVSATTTGLAAGVYVGHVTLTPSGSAGAPTVLGVTLSLGVASDWLTVDHDPGRSGDATDETALSTTNVAGLGLAWTRVVDGNVTAQPLYAHAVQVLGQTRDVLVVATGGNSIYALDAGTGSVLWSRNFGPPTANTWGLPDGFGIEAPPFIDRASGRIYTVSTDGAFRTLALADGTDVYPALALIANPVTNKVWGGLNRLGNGIYVATASNGGDVAPWRGQVYAIDVTGAPTLTGDFVVVPSIPAPNGGGGIWGYGGVSADWASNTLYATTAFDSNVDATGVEGTALYSNSVLALAPDLSLLGYFQAPKPTTVPCTGAPCDLDFASTPVVFQPAGCPTLVAAGSKNGNLYVFRAADLAASGVPLQVLTLNVPHDSLGSGGVGGVPAWSAPSNMLFVTDAGPGVPGVAGGVVGLTAGSDCLLRVSWSDALGGLDVPNSTPTIANGVVFVGEGSTGIVHAYDAASGAQLWRSGASYPAGATVAAPIVAGGRLYAGSWTSLATGGGVVGSFVLPSAPTLLVSPQALSFSAGAGGADPAPTSVSVSNGGGGSLAFTAVSDSPWLTVTPPSGSAPQTLQVAASVAGLAVGTYGGHVTVTAAGAQGSPAVIAVTLQVLGAGLSLDASASADGGAASATIASPTFSTVHGGELLLAFVATDHLTGSNTTVTGVAGGGLAWTLVARANGQSGTSEIWRAFATSPLGNVQVSATLSESVASSITVISFAGVDATGSGSGAVGATAAASAASGAPSASLLTTRGSSWVVGVGNDYDNAIARTVGPGQTIVHQFLSPTGDTYWVQMQNAPTPAAGSAVSINDTAPTGDRFNLAICEVRPP